MTERHSSSSALPWNPLEDRFAWVTGDQSVAVPVLPTVAQRAVAMASDPGIPVFKLADLVAKDQVLASRVLAMANSAASAPSMYISTIQEAVVRMGTGAVRNVVMAVSLTSRLQNRDIYGERGQELFDHALGAAYMARLVSERVESDADEEEAFLFGLMHDIGKLVILNLAYEYNRTHDARIPDEVVEQAISERHAMLGGLALRRWKLPESVDDPVMFHHNFAAAPRRRREAAMCHLANRLCHRYGFGCPAEPDGTINDEAMDELNLDMGWLEMVDAKAPGLYAVARSTFNG